MKCQSLTKLIIFFLFTVSSANTLSANEENFLLINGVTNEIVVELGPSINERMSPCSTFKITLSLMGYDAGILKDEKTPIWDFQDGYDDWLESWRAPQYPQSWMKYSCVWYSKILALQLGMEKIQSYLTSIEYGNKDVSGGLGLPGPTSVAWINSSLKISPKEQVNFIQKMLHGKLSISPYSIQMTNAILFKEELSEGWKLFGKTGWSGSDIARDGKTLEHGWFVGWIEKDQNFYPFAYLIREKKINLDQRIPRVKQLLLKSGVITEP
ncbi:MAG: class D beta-lactamase [Parachlamydiaceae bacterium]|nr:class D beta-lactamase [Parachlamydiaceae bacterium]